MTQSPRKKGNSRSSFASATGKNLEILYRNYNHRRYVHPDPLEFLYDYPDLRDREIVGLIASSLAYGRVCQILKSVSSILERMRPSPYSFLMKARRKSLQATFSGFRHRFTSGRDVASMLWAVRCILQGSESLYVCFLSGLREDHDTVLPALAEFVAALKGKSATAKDAAWGNFLLPDPGKGSACKRLNLFLRWMVREDAVDPGGWSLVPKAKLIIPLDTHMHRIARELSLTVRRQADLRTAVDITQVFRALSPDDPVRYDFSLTRLGIRKDIDMDAFLWGCKGGIPIPIS